VITIPTNEKRKNEGLNGKKPGKAFKEQPKAGALQPFHTRKGGGLFFLPDY